MRVSVARWIPVADTQPNSRWVPVVADPEWVPVLAADWVPQLATDRQRPEFAADRRAPHRDSNARWIPVIPAADRRTVIQLHAANSPNQRPPLTCPAPRQPPSRHHQLRG